jgi:hypothetical protein
VIQYMNDVISGKRTTIPAGVEVCWEDDGHILKAYWIDGHLEIRETSGDTLLINPRASNSVFIRSSTDR